MVLVQDSHRSPNPQLRGYQTQTWEGVEVSAQKHTVLLRRQGAFDVGEDRGWSSYPRRSGCRKGAIAQGHAAPAGAA